MGRGGCWSEYVCSGVGIPREYCVERVSWNGAYGIARGFYIYTTFCLLG